MKPAFSLLEIIFAILIVGIISTVAIPKFLDTKNVALATTIKRDVITATSAIQNYVLLNKDISKIEDSVELNSKNWTIEDLKATFKDNSSDCVIIEINKDDGIKLKINIEDLDSEVCKKIKSLGIETKEIDLY